jgi:hypothetical protein
MIACTVGDCGRPSRTRRVAGLCSGHHSRWLRTGIVGGPLALRVVGTQVQRILARAVITPGPLATPCLIVEASPGYEGRWRADRAGAEPRAYRTLYEHFVGPVPVRHTLDHLCVDGRCVAVDHLEPVTNAENVARQHERARLGAQLWLDARAAVAA